MLRDTLSRHTVRRLAIGGGEGLNMEYLFAGALGLIIISSLGLTLYFGVLSGPEKQVVDRLTHYKCDQCGEEFTIDPADQPQDPMGITRDKMAELYKRVDCPKCGATESSIRMAKCLNEECGKYYVPDSYRDPTAWQEGRMTSDICPHCGTDMRKLRRARARMRKQKK